MAKASPQTTWTSGRRKTTVARVKLMKGSGEFTVNEDKTLAEYYPVELDRQQVIRAFQVAGRDIKGFDISIKVQGGGKKSQVDAMALALAKALEELDPNLRPLLKNAGLLTRDPRAKERKKYGLKRARKAPQYSKR